MTKTLEQMFEALRVATGNHSNAARKLGISVVRYRSYRNGHANIPILVREYILLKGKEILSLSGYIGHDSTSNPKSQNTLETVSYADDSCM